MASSREELLEMSDGTINLQKIFRYSFIVIIVSALAWVVWFVINHSVVEITADNSDITITSESASQVVYATGKGKLMTVLKNGTYIVSAQKNNSIQRSKLVVSPFKITKISLTPRNLLQTQPITNFQTTSFYPSSSQLGFLDEDSGKLSFIGRGGEYEYSSDSYWIENAVWKSPTEGYAVARKIESDSKVFIHFEKTAISEVNLPTQLTRQTYFAYVTSASGELYVIEDGGLFRRAGESFDRIADISRENFLLSSTKNYISMLNRDSEENCELQIYDIKKSSLKKIPLQCIQSSDYIYSAEWSSDEKKLIVSSGGEVSVYSSDDYKKIYTVPDPHASNGFWDSNDDIVYASKNNLWRYSTKTGVSDVIATTPKYITLLNLRKGDGEYYFSGRTSSSVSLYKTSSTQPPLDASKLSESDMHQVSAGCSIRYNNFDNLQLIAGSSEQMKGDCESAIRDYLSSITVSTSIPIKFVLSEELGYSD